MEKYLSKQEVRVILENAPKGTDQSKLVEGLVNRGYTLEGLNDSKPETKTEQEGGVLSTVKDIGIGAVKGLTQTAQNAASPIVNTLNKVMPIQATGFSKEELDATNTAQTIGKGVEQVAEFVAPGTAGMKVAKVPGLVNTALRVGTEALGGGAVTLAQTGNLQDAKEGAILSGAFPVAGKVLDAVKSKESAGRIINSLIKTKLNDLSFGKNPGKTVAELGITGNSLEDLVENVRSKKDEIGSQIGAIMKQATEEGKKLSVADAFKPLEDALTKAKKAELSNAPLIKKLEDLKVDLTKGKKLDDLSPEEAFNIKQSVSELTKFTGNPSDDKAANAALMSVYGNIRNAINKAIGGDEIKLLNDQYGNLVTAIKAGEKRADSLQGQNLLSLGSKTAASGATLLSLFTGGAAIPAVLTGFAVAGGAKALESPAIRTRAAKWLAGKSAAERKEIFKTAPYLKGLIITNTFED